MTLDEFYRICDSIQPDEYGCKNYPSKVPPGYYKHVRINGRRHGVHRLALQRKLERKIQPGYYALHHCDHKSCVNPDHLYEGTDKDNVRDMIKRNPEWLENVRKFTRSAEHLARLKQNAKSPDNIARLKRWRESQENIARLKSYNQARSDQARKKRGVPPKD
jgi:hypothetical protein